VSRRALFWTYDPELPSFRHRLAPVVRELERRGWTTVVDRLPKRGHVARILARREALRRADRLIFAKINLSPGERWVLRRFARKVVFDFDDAIWLHRPRHPGAPPGRSRFRAHKFASACRAADLVLAGNAFLAARARRENGNVAIVPTGVDLAAYDEGRPSAGDGAAVVWIGLPENLPYLELVRPALARLAARGVVLRLRVVCSAFPEWRDVPIERVPWSSATEGAALAEAAIGIMPLAADDWSRGKCAFKVLQYMAAELPTVASPVGQNAEVIAPGETGFWAANDAEWESALGRLLASPEERRRIGQAGRESLRGRYDLASTIPLAADLVERGAGTADGATRAAQPPSSSAPG